MKKSKPIIEIKNLSKKFIIPKHNHNSIKELVVKGLFKNEKTEHQVLDNINLTINEGDFFGIVGRNGSGKSTLLKLIAGVYTPDCGEIKIHGRLTPFIELGVGFNPELSGRDNVFLNGALLGFTRKQMEAMYDEIVDFAELHDFMDLKLKNYSSGMQVRLAFSIAIKAEGDVLVLDEVLAVGDEAFQRKCNEYFLKAKESGKTVVLVTHSMDAVRRFCNKAVMIKDGKVFVEGQTDAVANSYAKENFLAGQKSGRKSSSSKNLKVGLSDIVPSLKINPLSPIILGSDDDVAFEIEYKITSDQGVIAMFSVIDESSNRSILDNQSEPIFGKGKHSVKYSFPAKNFNNINFRIEASLRDAEMYKNRLMVTEKGASILAFTNEKSVCRFGIRDEKGKTFSILNNSRSELVGGFTNCKTYEEWEQSSRTDS